MRCGKWVVVLFYDLEVALWHGAEDGRDDTVEGNDDTAVLAYAEYVALYTFEGTQDDLNGLAVGENDVGVVEKEQTFIGILGDSDKVFHGFLFDDHGFALTFVHVIA